MIFLGQNFSMTAGTSEQFEGFGVSFLTINVSEQIDRKDFNMKNLKMAFSSLVGAVTLFAAGSAYATAVTCNSIDSTFFPYYEVKLDLLDPTHDDVYTISITETDPDRFPGPITHEREATGRLQDSGAGRLAFDDGAIAIQSLDNGFLKAVMRFQGKSGLEMECALEAIIQPVAGVSN